MASELRQRDHAPRPVQAGQREGEVVMMWSWKKEFVTLNTCPEEGYYVYHIYSPEGARVATVTDEASAKTLCYHLNHKDK